MKMHSMIFQVKKIIELQNYLNKWCKECGVGTTYFEGKYKVRIPWEDYDE